MYMNLTKLQSGLYKPSYPSDMDESNRVKVGEEVRATKARNIGWHRKAFSLLNLGFSNQSKYVDFEIYRMVLTMRAGFVHFVTGTDLKEYPIPHSLSFDKMNADEFAHWYETIKSLIAGDCKMTAPEVEKEIQNYF